ncbi:hypothetical protein Psuf_087580 [Phytohabitans suffuscus]|uniref:Uncharacterized protein n=1 Tax=Phytohabitans suffuscus TaxID=624315 RepID=A0A6F8YZ49_9ACTN|nr:hypothetical protein Psuf_087580 [Phytohabitans suffuscus]
MRHFEPVVLGTLPNLGNVVSGAQPSRHSVFRERARVEWRIDDGGDPFHLLQAFLDDHGLPVRDVGRIGDTPSRPGAAAGASVFVSAAAGAWAAGAPAGPPSPAPAVPDLVAVAYDAAYDPADDPAGALAAHGGAPVAHGDALAGYGAAPVAYSGPGGPARGGAAGAAARSGAGAGEGGPWRLGRWRPSWTPAAHAGAVAAVRAAISRGDVYQVNVVGHAAAPTSATRCRRCGGSPGCAAPGTRGCSPGPAGRSGAPRRRRWWRCPAAGS